MVRYDNERNLDAILRAYCFFFPFFDKEKQQSWPPRTTNQQTTFLPNFIMFCVRLRRTVRGTSSSGSPMDAPFVFVIKSDSHGKCFPSKSTCGITLSSACLTRSLPPFLPSIISGGFVRTSTHRSSANLTCTHSGVSRQVGIFSWCSSFGYGSYAAMLTYFLNSSNFLFRSRQRFVLPSSLCKE